MGSFSSQTAMRLTLWFILILAFSVGMCCAIAVRTYYFEAIPIVVQNPEPTAKILIAKRTIPVGVDIVADSVAFQEVAVSEVPLGSLTSFDQVYRRQPAYPIPVGCPICEDLLAPSLKDEKQAAFLPAGSQFVTLDVARIRQGSKVLSPSEPFADVLSTDQRIDIRVVPRDDVQGALAEKKNEVLRTFVSEDFRESGELLLGNVQIHKVQKQSIAGQAAVPQIMLVLDKSEAAQLSSAAKKGQIRIVLSKESNNDAEQPEVGTISGVELAVSPVQEIPSVSIPMETAPLEVPLVSELSTPIAAEPTEVASVEAVVKPESEIDKPVREETVAGKAATEKAVAEKTVPEPKTPDIFDIFDSELPPAPVPDLAYSSLKEESMESANNVPPKAEIQPKEPADPTVPELVIKEKIRNDSPVIAFGTPAIRVISERPAEQKRMQAALPSTNVAKVPNEWKQDSALSTHSESVVELPRISRSLPFQTPNAAIPAKEYPKEAKQQVEPSVIPQNTPPTASMPTMPPSPTPIVTPAPVMPPIPNLVMEKVPSYSPFERRIYTVPTDDELNESYDVLPTPSLLRENSITESE